MKIIANSTNEMNYIKKTNLKCKIRLNNLEKIYKARNNHIIKYKIIKIIFSFFLFFSHQLIKKLINKHNLYILSNNIKRVGVSCLRNSENVGNILVKYAMLKKLEEFGLNATILTPINYMKNQSYFIKNALSSNLYIIKNNYSEELKENDFNYLLVNSDQTWAYSKGRFLYDIGFLKFSKNWNVKKFVYGASIGSVKWFYNKSEDEEIKKLLSNFTGFSFRENGTIKIAEKHLGIKGVLVLDPTLIIDKQYYLNEIKGYKGDFNSSEKYIFVYQLDNNKIIKKFINDSKTKLNYKIYKFKFNRLDNIEAFIFGISNCQAVITDSFHGTIFSIIFNKPFIAFINKSRGESRFDSLKKVFKLENRIFMPSENITINYNLLINKPKINQTLINQLRNFSINYLKKNLDIL